MDKLKFILLSIVVLSLLGLLGYWAVMTIQSGTEYQASKELKDLRKENEDFIIEVENLKNEIGDLESQVKEKTVGTTVLPVDTSKSTPVVAYKYQTLINELQKLADGNILMKLKSGGTRVGTVQQFLNIYNNTSNKIDNDYGAGTEKTVATFQKDQGLTGDGQAGKSTFLKMLDWLKKQG